MSDTHFKHLFLLRKEAIKGLSAHSHHNKIFFMYPIKTLKAIFEAQLVVVICMNLHVISDFCE